MTLSNSKTIEIHIFLTREKNYLRSLDFNYDQLYNVSLKPFFLKKKGDCKGKMKISTSLSWHSSKNKKRKNIPA